MNIVTCTETNRTPTRPLISCLNHKTDYRLTTTVLRWPKSEFTKQISKVAVFTRTIAILLSIMHLMEGNILFNYALSTCLIRLYSARYMVKDHSYSVEETRCRHYMGYSFRLAARDVLYASSHTHDNTHYGLCYTSRGALVRTRNSSVGRDERYKSHSWLWKQN